MGATLALVAAGTQALSQYQEGRNQAKAYEAQAKAAQQNAQIASKQRELTSQRYAQEQLELKDKAKLRMGAARAQAGAAGLQGGVGSSGDLLTSSQNAFEQDSQRLLQNQRNDTWSQYVNEVNYRNQANAYKTAASNSKAQGTLGALSTLAGAAFSYFGGKSTAEGSVGSIGSTNFNNGYYASNPYSLSGTSWTPTTYNSFNGNTIGLWNDINYGKYRKNPYHL